MIQITKQTTTMTTSTRRQLYTKPALEVVDLKGSGLMETELGVYSTSRNQERGVSDDEYTFAREVTFGDIAYDNMLPRTKSLWE